MEIHFTKHNKDMKDREEMYQVGNVIKKGSDLYLVATTHALSGGYFLIELSTGEAYHYSDTYDTLSELVLAVSTSDDILVTDVKVVAYTE